MPRPLPALTLLAALSGLLAAGCAANAPPPQQTLAQACPALEVTPGQILWTHPAREAVRSSATIDAQGYVYIGDEKGFLYKLDPATGASVWEFDCCQGGPTPEVERGVGQQCNIDSTAAIDREGFLWFGCWNGALNKVRPSDGTRVCLHAAHDEVSSSPAIGFDGTVYVGSEDRKLWAINPADCSVKWSKDFPGGAVYAAPAVTQHNLVINTSADDNVYAWTPSGDLVWEVRTGFDIQSSPAVDTDGTILVGSADHRLYAISPLGAIRWTFEARDRIYTSPVIGPDHTIYFGSSDGGLYALTADGQQKWVFQTGDRILSSPVLGCDGTIYIGSYDNHLYALQPDGTLSWQIELDGDIFGSPTIDTHGVLYVGTHGGTIYAIQTQSPGLANAPWPQYKGGRWHRANQCGADRQSCPCAQSGGNCARESCNGQDDDGDGETDEEQVCSPCPPGTCVDSQTATAACRQDGTCQLTCAPGFEGERCTRPKVGPGGPGSVDWVFDTGDSVSTVGAVDPFGNVYIGSGDYRLYKLNPKGGLECSYDQAVYRIDSPPLITTRGEVWFGAEDEQFHGMDQSCKPLCSEQDSVFTEGNVLGHPAELADGSLIFTSGDGRIYRMTQQNGHCARTVVANLDATITSGAVVLPGPTEALFVGSWAGLHRRQLDNTAGWDRLDVGAIVGRPALTEQAIIIGTKAGAIRAIDFSGQDRWRFDTHDEVWAPPATDPTGRVYVGDFTGRFFALTANGELRWEHDAQAPIRGQAAIQGPTVYLGADSGVVYALDTQDGHPLWQVDTGSPLLRSGPALTPDGRLIIGNFAGHIISIHR